MTEPDSKIQVKPTGVEVPSNTSEILAGIQSNLYDITLAERNNYIHTYEVIETYISEKKLLLSSVYKITETKRNLQELVNFHYAIYCNGPFEHANTLVNLMYEKLKSHDEIDTLSLNTVMKNDEFTITYDGRFIAKLYSIKKQRKTGGRYRPDQHNRVARPNRTSDPDHITPIIIDQLLYMPAEIEIIDVYHSLYTGSGNIEILQSFIPKLTDMVFGKVGGEISQIKSTCYDRKRDEIEAIKINIIKDFIRGRSDVVLLGPLAVDWITQGEQICPKFDRIQVMGTISASELSAKLTTFLEKLGRRYEINISGELDLMIPKDFRTTRTVFSLSIKTDMGIKEKPFLEYFNNAGFELIPAQEKDGVLIASNYVLSRFLFIDLYIYKYIYSIGKLDPNSYKNKQTRMMELIKTVHGLDNIADGFMGIYHDYDIVKKMAMRNADQYFGPYNVDAYVKKNGSVRQIGGKSR